MFSATKVRTSLPCEVKICIPLIGWFPPGLILIVLLPGSTFNPDRALIRPNPGLMGAFFWNPLLYSNTLLPEFCVETVQSFVKRYGNPETINPAQGAQFTGKEFTSMVLGQRTRLSMDGRGRATDNIAIERFWRSLKYKHVYLYGLWRYESIRGLAKSLNNYVTLYNEERKH